MKPQARIQATIEVLENIESNTRVPMDAVVGDYMRNRRYIGSKDRSDIAERAYSVMRAYAPEPEVIVVDNDIDEISCDGGGGPLGHPRIFCSFDGQDIVECGYCDRLFVKKRSKARLKSYLKAS